MNYLKTLSIALFAGLLFSSCDDKNKGTEGPALPDNGAYKGTVTVSSSGFTLPNVNVEFTVDEEDATVGKIKMIQVKFDPNMPLSIDMTIDGVTLAETKDGYSISGDGIVPTALMTPPGAPGPIDQPFAQYTVTDLTGTATNKKLTLEMMCGEYPMRFTGTRLAEK